MDKHRLGGMTFAGVAIAAVLAHQTIAGQSAQITTHLPVKADTRAVNFKDLSDDEGLALADTETQSIGSTMQPADGNHVSSRMPSSFAPIALPAVSMVDVAVQSALLQKIRLENADKSGNHLLQTSDTASKSIARQPVLDYQQWFDFRALLQPEGYVRLQWQNPGHNIDLASAETADDSFIVMIDPGHGGVDPGTRGHNGLLEKDLTLDIARRVRLFLSEFDHIDVQLTRNHDYGLSRQERVDAIKQTAADLVISLHFNHLPQSKINLVESFYAGPENIENSQNASYEAQRLSSKAQLTRAAHAASANIDFTEGSERLARTLQRHVYSEVNFGDDDAQNGGVKQETLFVLTRSFTPGVLMEISCLSHAAEADRLMSDEYRNRLAAALVDGIRSYHDSLQREPLKKRTDIGV